MALFVVLVLASSLGWTGPKVHAAPQEAGSTSLAYSDISSATPTTITSSSSSRETVIESVTANSPQVETPQSSLLLPESSSTPASSASTQSSRPDASPARATSQPTLDVPPTTTVLHSIYASPAIQVTQKSLLTPPPPPPPPSTLPPASVALTQPALQPESNVVPNASSKETELASDATPAAAVTTVATTPPAAPLQTIVSGTTYSLAPSGTAVFVNGVPTPASAFTRGSDGVGSSLGAAVLSALGASTTSTVPSSDGGSGSSSGGNSRAVSTPGASSTSQPGTSSTSESPAQTTTTDSSRASKRDFHSALGAGVLMLTVFGLL